MNHKVLEIAWASLFTRVYPESSTWLRLGRRLSARDAFIQPHLTGSALPDIERRIRKGDYDLIFLVVPGLPMTRPKWFSFRWSKSVLRERNGTWHHTVSRLLQAAGNTPIAVLDADDSGPLDPANLKYLDHCRAYFKRELPADPAVLFSAVKDAQRDPLEKRLAKLRPISLGLSKERIAAAPPVRLEKTTDVFFAGKQETRIGRRQGIVSLTSLSGKGVAVDLAPILPLPEYLDRCAHAWLAWSPSGLGNDCFRHYEAPLCRSVPVIKRAPVIRYRPLVEGTHCFFYDMEGEDLERVILDALGDKSRLAVMAEAAREHVLAHHTHEALCRYVLSEVF